ncbi:MAG: hypothetical protein KAJ19_03625 [Gammaproteobacteria bacterium]|nr:hypothetical protein [Gammaproteobacteria bacterium]
MFFIGAVGMDLTLPLAVCYQRCQIVGVSGGTVGGMLSSKYSEKKANDYINQLAEDIGKMTRKCKYNNQADGCQCPDVSKSALNGWLAENEYALVDIKKLEQDIMDKFKVVGGRFPPIEDQLRSEQLAKFLRLTQKYIVKLEAS